VLPRYDPDCYLCPGNTRAAGTITPQYETTFVFDNDFPALSSALEKERYPEVADEILQAETEQGICRVICFHPRHDLTLADMDLTGLRRLVDVWASEADELGRRRNIRYVQIFENRGSIMGASNSHPHGQIWATESIPNDPAIELKTQSEFFKTHGNALISEYLLKELALKERVVFENGTWVVVIPFWAVWPFETLVIPRRSVGKISALNDVERDGLASTIKVLASGYNHIFDAPFPYSMGFHAAPCDDDVHPEWTLHAHFYPPLLRSASVRKFMVGFELLGSAQRDTTPEMAAETLRNAIRCARQL
jgi:UDPglucose--hexose-1-phosphate uridylyltransferase